MARSKQNKSQTKKVDGKYRHETREERRARIQQQEEAREQCMKIIPYAVGLIVICMLAFAFFVRSVPPKTIPKPILQQPQAQGGIPEFMHVDTEPVVTQAKEEAKEAPKEESADETAPVEGTATTAEETIEL